MPRNRRRSGRSATACPARGGLSPIFADPASPAPRGRHGARDSGKVLRMPGQPLGDLLPSQRLLLGPGPTMADPRVLRAMAAPLLGQFDPDFTAIMNEVMGLTRLVFQTEKARAFPVPGTGRAGLEAAIGCLVERGGRVGVGWCGVV